MLRVIPLLAAAVVSSAFLASAAAAAPNYQATLAVPASQSKLVSSERQWSCAGLACVAGGEATSAAARICSRLAREVGPIAAFTANGRALDAGQLAACNEKAASVSVPAAAK
ncbi:MAG: hypothetical protein INF91_00370 [Alphaproteobacteria bacterium]|nr:hypothetical protein [Alphaproteobacteria bacterium]